MGFLEQFVVSNPAIAYLILFVGMFIEGEIFFVTASIFAIQGELSLTRIVIISLIGVILGDITWYYMGRFSKDTRLGIWLSKKTKGYEPWINKNLISNYWKMAFFSKFLYYVNRFVPLMAGWQKMDFKKFLKIHVGAAIAWVSVMWVASHFLRFIIEAIGAKAVLHRIEWVFIGFGVLFIGGEYLLKNLFAKKINKSDKTAV
ncbi:MAG: hypothetical protein G01um10143_206 [Parcubacteria group bacterium Gr01-1014_3]|nr:MAG: hypothetical protein G01um10143_206 [Parcubacteria group bacterium Gr01-1014_3]